MVWDESATVARKRGADDDVRRSSPRAHPGARRAILGVERRKCGSFHRLRGGFAPKVRMAEHCVPLRPTYERECFGKAMGR
jgi:hypothetical protein